MPRLRTILVVWLLAVWPAVFGPAGGSAQEIVGGGERRTFEPGERVLYEADLAHCPVGEFLDEWRIARGSYECARFADRIWVRPLEHGTTVWMRLPELPAEWALEFTVHAFEPGRPGMRLRLHGPEAAERLAQGPQEDELVGAWIGVDEARFGAKENERGSLDCCLDLVRRIEPGKDHHVAIQVRRGRVRFFVDGTFVGQKPFRPEVPPAAVSLYFRRTVEAPRPFAEAPVLVTGVRLSAYERPEAAPQPEEDLLRALGAEETAEGIRVRLQESILFDFGKWELKPEAGEVLDRLARLAAVRPGPIRIEGHTDDVGSETFNLVLSELRAHVVALALARRGVDAGRLQPVGYGESRPVVPNDSDANRARNRRVEVLFVATGDEGTRR